MWINRVHGNDIHVVPKDDQIEHEPKDCVCGPTIDGVPTGNMSVRWMYTHHSLDGRELKEK